MRADRQSCDREGSSTAAERAAAEACSAVEELDRAGCGSRADRSGNAACSEGRIECGPTRTGLMPPLSPRYVAPFASTAWSGVRFLLTYKDISPRPTDSSLQLSSKEKPKLTRSFVAASVHAPLAGIDQPPAFHGPGQWVMASLLVLYRLLTVIAVLAAAFATLAAVALAFKNPANPQAVRMAGLLVTLALLVFARIALVSLVEITSFQAVTTTTWHPPMESRFCGHTSESDSLLQRCTRAGGRDRLRGGGIASRAKLNPAKVRALISRGYETIDHGPP